MITVYGIPNCGSVKKCLKFFKDHNIEVTFVDFKKNPPNKELINKELIKELIEKVETKKLINKCSSTWKTLSSEEKGKALGSGLQDSLMNYPLLIKRPVVVAENFLSVGVDEEKWSKLI